ARCSTPRSKGGGVSRYCVSDTPYRAASSGQTSVTVATAGLAPKDRTRALRPSSLGPSWQRTVDRRSLGSRTNALPPMLHRRLDGRPSLGTYRAALQRNPRLHYAASHRKRSEERRVGKDCTSVVWP